MSLFKRSDDAEHPHVEGSDAISLAAENARLQTRLSQLEGQAVTVKAMLNSATNPMTILAPDGTILHVNDALLKLSGFTRKELLGRQPPYPWWIPTQQGPLTDRLKRAMRDGTQLNETEFQRPDGSRYWVSITSTPIFQNRTLQVYVSSWVDISEQRLARDRLNTLEALADQANFGLAVTDNAGEIRYVNPYMAERHGYSAEEATGQPMSIFHTASQMEDIRWKLDVVRREGRFGPLEVWHRHRDGSIFPMLMSAFAIHSGGQRLFGSSAIDVSENKTAEADRARLEEALLAMEKRLDVLDKDSGPGAP